MGRVLAIANPKGGCGKTTVAINLTAALAAQNRKVTLVDLDLQAHATIGFGIDPGEIDTTLHEILTCPAGEQPDWKKSLLTIAPGIHLLPGAGRCHDWPTPDTQPFPLEHLKRLVKQLAADNDYVLLDCPSGFCAFAAAAVEAAPEILVPVEAGRFSQHSFQQLASWVNNLRQKGREIMLYGLAANFDNRSAFARLALDEQRDRFPGLFLRTAIHVSSKVREAAYCGRPVMEHARFSQAAQAFQMLADEIASLEKNAAALALADAVPQRALQPLAENEVALFRIHAPAALSVSVAGSFNGWRAHQLPLHGPDENGYWHTSLVLPRGTHRYRFLVDGTWTHDPKNPMREHDTERGTHSLMSV